MLRIANHYTKAYQCDICLTSLNERAPPRIKYKIIHVLNQKTLLRIPTKTPTHYTLTTQHNPHPTMVNENEDEVTCPICWASLPHPPCNTTHHTEASSAPTMLVTPCGHTLCRTCLEGIVHRNASNSSSSSSCNRIPCYGTCPMCRRSFSVFQVRLWTPHNNNNNYKNNPLAYERKALPADIKEKFRGLHLDSPLSDGLSIYFDLHSDEVYMERQKADLDQQLGPSGDSIPVRTPLEHCHWHAKTRTFHGRVYWCGKKDVEGMATTFHGADYWDVVVQMSSNMSYVCGGGVIKHRRDVTVESSSGDDCHARMTSLDGLWRVYLEKFGGRFMDVGSHRIVAGSLHHSIHKYQLLFDEEKPYYNWKNLDLKVTADKISYTDDGTPSEIIFLTDNEQKSQWKSMKLVRENDVDNVNFPSFEYYAFDAENIMLSRMRENGMRHYRFVYIDSPTALIPDTIWGNAFLQGGHLGLASYHFISEQGEGFGGAYISYESPQCSMWPPLDNGNPVPSRMAFQNFSWDADTLTFRGTIDWFGVHGTTWNGSSKWVYRMVFDKNLITIKDGETVQFQGEQRVSENSFENELSYVNQHAYQTMPDEREHLQELMTANSVSDFVSIISTRNNWIGQLRSETNENKFQFVMMYIWRYLLRYFGNGYIVGEEYR